MKILVAMPQMGESVAEGTIVRWLKKPGDRVGRDEAILEISTDKVDTEVPAPAAGTLVRLLAQEGATLAVGSPLAEIESEEQTAEAKTGSEKSTGGHFSASAHELVTFSRTAAAVAPAPSWQPLQPREPVTSVTGRKSHSPSVMRAALAAGLTLADLDTISGSGFHGRVTEADVAGFATSGRSRGSVPSASGQVPAWLQPVVEDGDQIVDLSTARKRIAQHMTWSRRLAAHATAFADLDMSAVISLKQPDVSYLAFFSIAVVKLLKEYPVFNSCVLDDDRIVYKARVRLGIAVAVDDELFVPVIRDADELNFSGMARAIRDVSQKARMRKLATDDFRGGTFTITNPGMFGGVTGTPIIHQPQVAILGLGAIVKKPVVVDDAISIRPMMSLSLSFDHRVIDGAAGFKFLEALRIRLSTWKELL